MRRAVRRRIEGFMMMDVRFYSLGKKVKGPLTDFGNPHIK